MQPLSLCDLEMSIVSTTTAGLETWTKDAQRGHICRSTSIFLISAMALAGLRPFGQA